MFFPSFYSEGAGAREIITIGCKYNSTEQGTTTTSGLHDSLKREPSLASLDSFAGRLTRRKLIGKSSQKVARLSVLVSFFMADGCSC